MDLEHTETNPDEIRRQIALLACEVRQSEGSDEEFLRLTTQLRRWKGGRIGYLSVMRRLGKDVSRVRDEVCMSDGALRCSRVTISWLRTVQIEALRTRLDGQDGKG